MKKLLIIIPSIVIIGFLILVAIAFYKMRPMDPAIIMKDNIDTLSFKTNKESDFFFQKSLNVGYNEPLGLQTYDCSSFNEKCYVSVMIDTTTLHSVLIDTGSDISIFNISNFNPKQIGGNNSIYNVWKKEFPYKNVYIDSIGLGKTLFLPFNNSYGGYTRSLNIIGGDILKYFVWKIDNIRREMYFSQDTSAFQYEDCVAVPFVLAGNKPSIKCKVNGTIYNVILDTGNSDFLHIVDATADNSLMHLPESEPRDSFFRTVSVYDDIYESYSNYGIDFDRIEECRTISEIQIENLSFFDEIVEHNKYSSNLLGWDFIQRFEFIIIDYINQVLYLGPVSKHKSFFYLSSIRSSINTTGLMISLSKPHIITTITDSLSEKGLSLGDTIIAIDGKAVTDSALLKTIYSKESVTITVKDENNEKNYTLYRKQYFSEPDTVMSYGEMALLPLHRNMEIANKETGGRIFRYYNWGPTYLTSDNWKIFDQQENFLEQISEIINNLKTPSKFYNIKIDSIVSNNKSYYNLRIDSISLNGTLYGIKTDSVFIGKGL